MTKTKLGQSDAKPSEYSSTPLYSSVQVIDGEQPQEQVSDYNLLATAVAVTCDGDRKSVVICCNK